MLQHPLLALAAVLPLSSSSEIELRHAPAEGSVRATSIAVISGITGADLEVFMNGEPVPEMFLPQLDLVYEDELALEVQELVLAAGEDGPTEWARRYAAIDYTNQGSFGMEDSEGRSTGIPWDEACSSPLVDAVLALRAEDGELAAEVLDGPSLPEGLGLDLSFAALLPEGPVAVGDSWELEDEALALLIEPGGDLALELAPETQSNLFPDFDERDYEGSLTLRLLDHEGGAARIELEGEVERITTMPGDLTPVPVVDGAATDTVTEVWNLSGELVWSTTDDALVELTLEGAMDSDTFTQRDPDLEGPTYESTYTVGGQWRLEVTAGVLAADEAAELVEAAAAR